MAIEIEEIVEANGLDAVSSGTASETSGASGINITTEVGRTGYDGSTYYQTGYIFQSIPIKQGATILNAHMHVYGYANSGDTVNWKIAGLERVGPWLVWDTNFRPGTGGGANYTINQLGDVLVLTSDQGGPVSIDIANGTYSPADLATELENTMNADSTLTGSGTITFSVSYSSSRFTIDAGSGHTIAYTTIGSDADWVFGFNQDHSAAQTITSDYDVPGRCAETAAKVDWDRTGWANNTWYESPDITTIIQELVNKTYWVENSASIILVIRNDGSNNGYFDIDHRLLDEGDSEATKLHITYSQGGQVIGPCFF